MMTKLSQQLKTVMEKEIELIQEYCDKEGKVKDCLFTKNWRELDVALKTTAPLTDRINALEQERNTLFKRLTEVVGESESAGFYQVVVHLPYEVREELAALYRELKFSVFQLQGVTNNIDTYICSVKETMDHVLDELFPHRKGNLYAKDGKPTSAKENPMVISHHL